VPMVMACTGKTRLPASIGAYTQGPRHLMHTRRG
jgi:hypothetical protein